MIIYTLIKKYPYSPELGSTVEIPMNPGPGYYQEFYNCETFPEFWKKESIEESTNLDSPFYLITDDEKQLLEGDTYYIVNPVNYELTVQFVKEDSQASIWKKFAIRKNAKKYIKSKQKCLCMEDVLEILKEKKLI